MFNKQENLDKILNDFCGDYELVIKNQIFVRLLEDLYLCGYHDGACAGREAGYADGYSEGCYDTQA